MVGEEMNLIEQLGGYEEAKKVFLWNPDDYNFYSSKNKYWSDNPIYEDSLDIGNLDKELLQYRREHNIFELGDYIIHDDELKVFAMWSDALKGCAYIGYAYEENGEMAHKSEFRHATDEEIEAGKRL